MPFSLRRIRNNLSIYLSNKIMNKPYTKEYNENGEVINPIIGSYNHQEKNRRERRFLNRKERFHGNGRSLPLTVYKDMKYVRFKQLIKNWIFPEKNNKIEHYILLKPKIDIMKPFKVLYGNRVVPIDLPTKVNTEEIIYAINKKMAYKKARKLNLI